MSGATRLSDNITEIMGEGMVATRIVVSRRFFEEEIKPLTIHADKKITGIVSLLGIPAEITEDLDAPNWVIEFERRDWSFKYIPASWRNRMPPDLYQNATS